MPRSVFPCKATHLPKALFLSASKWALDWIPSLSLVSPMCIERRGHWDFSGLDLTSDQPPPSHSSQGPGEE